jgi:hypothetical protein
MDKRFWLMSAEEVGAFIESKGLDAWKAKLAADRAAAPAELAKGPNPWAAGHEDAQRQKIIAELAPKLAERLKDEAGAADA